MDQNNNLGKILDYILKNEEISRRTLRLVASENIPQVEERLPYMLDMFARYSFLDENIPWKYPTFYLKEIELKSQELLKQYLNCKFINLKPISGLNGMLSTIAAFNDIGDTVMSLSPLDGGHAETASIVKKLGYKSKFLPFKKDTWQIDIDALKNSDDLDSINMVYLDICMASFPQPVAQLREVVPKKTLIVYDASHVVGLILGKQFQQPLDEGADILISNTHKTIPGPHKGIFATNKRLLNWQYNQMSGHFISHHHIADVACLGLVLEKGVEFFEKYALTTISNAKYLAEKLYNKGIKVQLQHLGFTQCHQIWIECGDQAEVSRIVDDLNSINIVVNGALIPSLDGGWGIRLGLQEVSNREITQKGLDLLSEIIFQVINNNFDKEDLEGKKNYILDHCFQNKMDYTKIDKILETLIEEKDEV
ncbi:MAG: hypothetical protein KAX49_07880 [Halanaerobiales bacterium]|nr:hypothetical protein [Halanaerobiales bacterium]